MHLVETAHLLPPSLQQQLAANTGGLGEPLNVVISALSDALILTDEGLTDFMWSVDYSEEFLGQSLGERQAANLGDGNGQCEFLESAELRHGKGAELTRSTS